MNLVKSPSYIGLEFHTFMKTLLCPHSCLSERIVFPVLFQKSLLPSIIVLSFHTLKGWALVFFHSFLGLSEGIHFHMYFSNVLFLLKMISLFTKIFYRPSLLYHSILCGKMPMNHQSFLSGYFFSDVSSTTTLHS